MATYSENVHTARVYINMARAFRLRGSRFAFVLIDWAGDRRRKAITEAGRGQLDLLTILN